MQPARSLLTAFADDLAMVMHSAKTQLAEVVAVLLMMGRAALVDINGDKTVLVPLGKMTHEALRRWLKEYVPALAGAVIADRAEYLGIMLGPGAEQWRLSKAAAAWRNRTRDIKRLLLGPIRRVVVYNAAALGCLSYPAQMAAIPQELLKEERNVSQRVLGWPRHALPFDLLVQLKRKVGKNFLMVIEETNVILVPF